MSKKNKNSKTNKPAPQQRSIHEDVPQQVAQRIAQEQPARVVQSSFENYSGPIPPPALLKGYEEILAGATDRILTMAENQSQHRHDMEKGVFEMEPGTPASGFGSDSS